jgi:TonB-linked SusC/RagA family outer membrane protein
MAAADFRKRSYAPILATGPKTGGTGSLFQFFYQYHNLLVMKKQFLLRRRIGRFLRHSSGQATFLGLLCLTACPVSASVAALENLSGPDSNHMRNADVKIAESVSDEKGSALPGVTVKLKNGIIGTVTDANGKFELTVPEDGVLVVSSIGYVTREVVVSKTEALNIVLTEDPKNLEELVVTGYTSQRKKDIIGAVAVVSAKELQGTPSANLAAQLQGRAAGVTVSSSGDPGTTANIRIRGFASYGNNNPLYVIDGVATTDISRINPNDIESLQVLKDASSASIYGARAANGVVIITTKHGQAGKTTLSYDSYIGFQKVPTKSFPRMLTPVQDMEYLTRTQVPSYIDPVFGKYGSFAIPDFYVVSNNFKGGLPASDPRTNPDLYTIADHNNVYQILKPSPEGTDWFKAMTQTAVMHNHQLSVSGGTEQSSFYLGLNYLNQQGIFKYTGYNRYSIRLNSTFKPSKYFSLGENLQVSFDNRTGQNSLLGEGNAWSDAYRSSSFVPLYDIKDGWGGSLIGGLAGNGYNPVAGLYRAKDWQSKTIRAAGNVFATVNITDYLSARTSFGIDASLNDYQRQTYTQYESAEKTTIPSFAKGFSKGFNWIWTNTVNFKKVIAEHHEVQLVLGTEAVRNTFTGIDGSKNRYDFQNIAFMNLNSGLPQSLGDISLSEPGNPPVTISSYFARLDYAFKGKYLLNATMRRDEASVFGPSVRTGYFPAVGAAWRISDEAFLKDMGWLDNMMLRGGYGTMGSISNVPSLNQFNTFRSTVGVNNYDLAGSGTGSSQGFGVSRQGNENTKWETTKTLNLGIDISAFKGALSLTIDAYTKNTSDLLVPDLANGLEMNVTKPLINLGTMNNKGIDIVLSKRGEIAGDLKYDAALTFSAYKNSLTKLNNENTVQLAGAGRLGNVSYTGKGYPVSSFYGYTIDGFYNDQSEVDNGPRINGQPGIIGSWKYKDLNGDGNINPADAGVIGNPHPKFQTGFNLGLSYKNFDFTGFLFWNYGNQLFNYTKYFTYMGALGGGIAEGKLTNAWTPETASSAKTPRLGVGQENGYTSFVTSNPSTFYVESGSYLRLKNLQLGYTLPKQLFGKARIQSLRVYVQAQNLFTVTKYSGGDPDINLVSSNGSDQRLGVDLSGYPNPRQLIIGLNFNF